ncbi:MAG TPA: RluA family pseudouridine synthase [Thermoanaerobaculia bacterium]|nr:RluA family pseudouridine synthase [Thermoanaerobaculia bacterium]
MRLDQAVAARYPEVSRRKARELIAARRVLVNDRPVAIASREVSDEDRVALVADFDLAVLRETADWIAVDKPSGMPTQPARDREQRSLEELMRVRFGRIYLVHRLDTGTSGVVLFARTQPEAARLSQLFAAGAMRKLYVALVEPPLASPMTIETPIEGKDALTFVQPRDGNRVEVEIRTGRTHQIRIHLSSIGHPVVGDRRYGGRPAPRLMLHAWRIEHESMGVVEAPVPRVILSPAEGEGSPGKQ